MPEFRVIWLRHGEAYPKRGNESDQERALTDQGRSTVLKTALALQKKQWLPQLALVSHSRRTQETFAEFISATSSYVPFKLMESLYLGGWDDVRKVLRMVSGPETVLLVGHNPGFSDAVGLLTGRSVALSPGDAACVRFKGDSWEEAVLSEGLWEFDQVISL